MNCKNCIHWEKCSKTNGKTRYYGEKIASDNVEELCEWFISTADVVPKSEVVEMQKEQLGRLKEIKSEVERVTVEYEAMRGAANSYKMHYEQAKTEVERLQAEVDQLHALLECGVFANSVEDWQKFLNEKRAEVAREIFEEIDALFVRFYDDTSYSSGELGYDIAELKKKYTEGTE